MSVIENFNELSEEELAQFAADLVKKLNNESIFTSEAKLVLNEVEADRLTGDLIIGVYSADEDSITVEREASWQAYDEDSLSTVEDADFANRIEQDAMQALKTQSVEINGYRVSIFDISADVYEELDVDVQDYTAEDSGIGSYDYWGFEGYDSHPYYEVSGVISYACGVGFGLTVEPIK